MFFKKIHTTSTHIYYVYEYYFFFFSVVNSMCITYFDQSFDKQTQTHLDDLANIVHFKIKYTYDTYLLGTLLIQVYTFFFCKKIYGIKHHLLYNAIEVFLPFLLPLFLLFFPPPLRLRILSFKSIVVRFASNLSRLSLSIVAHLFPCFL